MEILALLLFSRSIGIDWNDRTIQKHVMVIIDNIHNRIAVIVDLYIKATRDFRLKMMNLKAETKETLYKRAQPDLGTLLQ